MDNTRGLFRGKRTDNGEWVTGYYAPAPDGKMTPSILTYTDYGAVQWNEIDPSTRGEYTGLTDKNGKMIFEGDICTTDANGTPCQFVIKYGAFEPRMFYDLYEMFLGWRPKEMLLGLYGISTNNSEEMFIVDGMRKYEVIGNIHDNPELMGRTRWID